MITNRTAQDVELAKTLRLKLQAGQDLTLSETEQIERGSCTITMLNRIESKMQELADILNGYSYQNHIETKEWQVTELLDYPNYWRILNNLHKLKNAYYAYQTTPLTPQYMYGYKEANDIEKILVDIENMINDMVGRFKICGTFNCGVN